MTSWFERGRPAIFQALADVCERIDNELLAELQREPPPLDGNNDYVDGLKEENARLRAQLAEVTTETPIAVRRPEKVTAQQSSDTAVPDPSTSGTAISPEETTDWKAEYKKLSPRFSALANNFKIAREALEKRRNERDKWIEHAALLERKIKVAEEEHGIQILDRGSRHARATNHLAACGDGTRPSPNASFASVDSSERNHTTSPPIVSNVHATETEELRSDVTPSDNTQGEADEGSGDKLPFLLADAGHDQVPIKEEPSSDAPVVVSEHLVRKRKQGTERSEENAARRVKTERSGSSSPVRPLAQYEFNPQDSIDLGDVAQRLMTPRKRKELEESRRLQQVESMAIATPTTFARSNAQPQTVQVVRNSSALTPISVNRRIIRSGGDKPQTRPRRTGLGRGIAHLAEDGGLYDKNVSEPTPKASRGLAPVAKGRLDALLNKQSPVSSPFRARQEQDLASGHDLPIPERRELPFEKCLHSTKKRDTPTAPKPRRAMPSVATPVRDSRGPKHDHGGSKSVLRHKQVAELRPEDFKINPQANEGHDFAFSDVIRDKNQRACLPGCVDMHCCGKQFRALALSQKPNLPLTAAQRQEEQKLLEDYLGDYAYRLAATTKEERAEIWLEAKTQELANKYGKHRHRYSRMQSPPGFWNADFPNTQDLEADRAEAAKRERTTIEERYREARRPGGRWLFRDE